MGAFSYRLVKSLLTRRWLRRDILWTLFIGVACLAYILFRLEYFSFLLPNTYFAKKTFLTHGKGWAYLQNFIKTYGGWLFYLPLLFPLFLPLGEKRPYFLLIYLWLLGYIAFIISVGGDWMRHYRFITFFLPFVSFLLQEGLKGLYHYGSRRWMGKAASGLALALLVLVVSMTAMKRSSLAKGRGSVNMYGQYNKVYKDELFRMASLLPQGSSLLIPELGFPAFSTDLRIVDIIGLGNVHIAHNSYYDVDRYLWEIEKPTAIKVHSDIDRALQIADHRSFREDYVPVNPSFSSYEKDLRSTYFLRRDVFTLPEGAEPAFQSMKVFGGKIGLLGFKGEKKLAKKRDPIPLTLDWKPLKPVEGKVHCIIRAESQKGQGFFKVYEPLGGLYPSMRWKEGERLYEKVEVSLPESFGEGIYELSLGMEVEGIPLPVMGDGQPSSAFLPLVKVEWNTQKAREASEALYQKAMASLGQGNWPLTLHNLEESLLLEPDSLPVRQTSVLLLRQKGMEALSAEKTSEALNLLKKAQHLEPRDEEIKKALRQLSTTFFQEGLQKAQDGDEEEALKRFSSSLSAYPAHSRARHELEKLWRRRAERKVKARQGIYLKYLQAIEESPEDRLLIDLQEVAGPWSHWFYRHVEFLSIPEDAMLKAQTRGRENFMATRAELSLPALLVDSFEIRMRGSSQRGKKESHGLIFWLASGDKRREVKAIRFKTLLDGQFHHYKIGVNSSTDLMDHEVVARDSHWDLGFRDPLTPWDRYDLPRSEKVILHLGLCPALQEDATVEIESFQVVLQNTPAIEKEVKSWQKGASPSTPSSWEALYEDDLDFSDLFPKEYEIREKGR